MSKRSSRPAVARVLVVHDDLEVARILARELSEQVHCEVGTCASAESALRELERRPVGLILADAHLSGINGFQLCRLLHSPAYLEFSSVPVILLSASFRGPRAAELARDAGALTFLEDPRDRLRLAGIVEDVLHGRFADHGNGPEAVNRALIVCQDDALRHSVTASPDLDGFDVAAVGEVAVAEAALSRRAYALVLVAEDCGAEASRLVQKTRELRPQTILLVLRTAVGLGHFSELLCRGADDYVDAPVASGELKTAFRRARLCRELVADTKRLESSDHRLRASEARCRRQSGLLRSLMETSGDGIVLCDESLVVTTLNPAALKIFSTTRRDVVGRPIHDLVGPEGGRKLGEFIARPRGTEGESFEVDRVIGSQARALSIGINRRDESEGGPGLLLIVRDISRERDLRAQLAQSQKLDSLGALAGGVAHDFNNILATILPNAEMIASTASSNERILERARTIQVAARRGGELTRRLLAFARPDSRMLGATSANPNACVESTVAMLRETLGRNVWVDMELMGEAVEVAVSPSQLEHALLNLGINARDAMPEGGTLSFRTCMADDGALGSSDDARVSIVVEDTGCGMDEATRARVFEPFFTTKDVSKGTGLGLSIVSETVRAAKGTIAVDSRSGEGTCVRITLPASVASCHDAEVVPVVEAGAGESILVVDDEEPVRRLTAEMLRRLGYAPETVASGEHALERCRQEEFDLVLLDMIMTGMDGCATYDTLRSRRSGQKAMIATGDAQNPRLAELSRRGVVVLEKPFSLEALAAAVHTSLRATSADIQGQTMSKGTWKWA